MQPKRAFQLLILLNAGLIFIVFTFLSVAMATDKCLDKKSLDKKSDIISVVIIAYELTLAGIENGNLKSEPGNFFLTLYKWAAFLNDMASTKNSNLVIERHNVGD